MFSRFVLSLFLVTGLGVSAQAANIEVKVEVFKISKTVYAQLSRTSASNIRRNLLSAGAELKSISEILFQSGDRAQASSLKQFEYVDSIEDGEAVREQIGLGNVLESEATVGEDGYTIKVGYSFDSREKLEDGTLLVDGAGNRYLKPYFYEIKSNSAVSIRDGQSLKIFAQPDVEAEKVVVGILSAASSNL